MRFPLLLSSISFSTAVDANFVAAGPVRLRFEGVSGIGERIGSLFKKFKLLGFLKPALCQFAIDLCLGEVTVFEFDADCLAPH